jgi:hypothetical protein
VRERSAIREICFIDIFTVIGTPSAMLPLYSCLNRRPLWVVSGPFD